MTPDRQLTGGKQWLLDQIIFDLFSQWENYAESGSASVTYGTFHFDTAADFSDSALHNRQTETRSALFCREEGFENTRTKVIRNPGTSVSHRKFDLFMRIGLNDARFDKNRTATRSSLYRVEN